MTEEQKNSIIKCRGAGIGYATIAKEIGLTKDAVAAFCRRNGLTGNMAGKAQDTSGRCKECKTAPDAAGNLQLTAIPGGNTAPTPAISKTGSKGAEKMTEGQFQAEKLYYISLSIAKSMLEKAVIDEEVLSIIDTKLLEKYCPISGTLLAGKPLT